jgi:hypothetical protein
MTKLHRDHQETDDLYLAALCIHQGYRIFRCQATDYGKSTFGLLVPEMDWKYILEEYNASDSTIVDIKAYGRACSGAFSIVRQARKNGGSFTQNVEEK